ncbi:MAG TPA: hypothetical protein VK797_15635 [Tepidisphaeraceae bacterium]|nr:hypothetical protein [Tepidisphaeraceae bacterium]
MHKVAGQVLAGALTCFSLCTVCPTQTTALANQQDWQKPTLVTLHLREVSAQQALESLEQQSGLKIEAESKHAADQLMLTPVNIDADHQPFWSVLEKIAEAADLAPGPNLKTQPGVSLVEGDQGAWSTPFTAVHGPFAIALTRVAQNATIEYGVVNPYPSAPVTLTLYICPEPKVPVQAVTGIHVSKCVDETGFPIASDERSMFQMYGWPSNQSIELRPQNAGKIALIEGQVTVRVASGHQHIEVPDILAARNVIQTIDGVRISINQCVKEGPRGRGFPVQLTFLKDDQSDDQFKAIVARLTRAPPDLLDASGKKLNHEDPMNPGQPTPDGWRFRFPFNRGLGPQPTMGEPVKLSWDVPTQTQEAAIPFSFKDVPLPGGKSGSAAVASNTAAPPLKPPLISAPATDYSGQVKELVAKLGAVSETDRADAAIALSLLPPEAFSQMEAAARGEGLPPAADRAIKQIVARQRPWQQGRLRRKKVQDDQRSWQEQSALDAYQRLGRHDPKWDALAQAAIHLYLLPRIDVSLLELRGALERARAAGCEDPLILFMTGDILYRTGAAGADVLGPYRQGHDGLARGHYPAYWQTVASIELSDVLYRFTSDEANAKKQKYIDADVNRQINRLHTQAMADWPGVVKDGAPPELLGHLAYRILNVQADFGLDIEKLCPRLAAPLEAALPNSAVPLIFKGRYYIDWGWKARGGGFAGTVTDEGWRLLRERLAVAEQALQKAYELDPNDPAGPTAMLTVELGQGRGRDVMEKWFARAMAADPDHYAAGDAKLNYLMPKWYGSEQDAVDFGRECYATGNWRGGLPRLLALGRVSLAGSPPDSYSYLGRPDVWNDVQRCFEPYLRVRPDDIEARSTYCLYAGIGGHWDIARKQFAILGPHVSPIPFDNHILIRRYQQSAQTGQPPPRDP